MAERKHKRVSEGMPELDEEASILLEPTQVELGSGYTLSVSFDEEQRPVVDVKTYGRVNLAQLKKEIEGAFPNARIRQREQVNTLMASKKKRRKLAGENK